MEVKIEKTKKRPNSQDIFLVNNDSALVMTEKESGYLYWFLSSNYKNQEVQTFEITKENYQVYQLFESLYEKIKNCEVYDDKEANESLKRGYAYNLIYNNNRIVWRSEDVFHTEPNAVHISKKEEKIVLELHSYDDDILMSKNSVRFNKSASQFYPFNKIFIDLYLGLQKLDFSYQQMHIEEYLYGVNKQDKLCGGCLIMEKELVEYKAEHLLKMVLRELKNRGIDEINRYQLECDLYYYSQNPKYKVLFKKVGTRGKSIPLLNTFEILEKRKEVMSLSYALDDYAIKDSIYGPLGEFDEVEILLLINDLVEEYLLRKKVVKTAHGNIKLYGTTPNGVYTIGNGIHLDKNIEWQLITDGKVSEEVSEHTWNGQRLFISPEKEVDLITVRDGQCSHVQVEDANFTIMNGMINDELVLSLVYSESLEEEKLTEQAKYATLDKIPSNSYVKVLSVGR